jgi:hypothetical protein
MFINTRRPICGNFDLSVHLVYCRYEVTKINMQQILLSRTKLPSISGSVYSIRNLGTRHTVVTRDPT